MGQVGGSDARSGQPRRFGRTKCRNCFKVFDKPRPWSKFCPKPVGKCRNQFHNDNRKLEKIDE